MTIFFTRKQADALADKICDAYSFDRFVSWKDCAQLLRELGYGLQEAEAVLRSKHMRWAGDCAENPNRPTVRDLEHYLTMGHGRSVLPGTFDLKILTEETFS